MYSITPVSNSDGKSDLETIFIELMSNATNTGGKTVATKERRF